MSRLIVSFILLTILLTACNPVYRMDIQQGNYITQAELGLLKPGMTRDQVQDLLGTPLLTDDFRQNRWDYVFYLKEGNKTSRRTGVTVFFDQASQVTNIRTD